MSNDGPRVLAIETSGASGSAAVGRGDALLAEAALSSQARHATDLFDALEGLLSAAGWRPKEIEECCVSVGPGSFTGLRVAVTTARHLSLACGCRIVAVPTLDAVAEASRHGLADGAHMAAILDAKRSRVFGAVYRRDGDAMTALSPAAEIPFDALYAAAPKPCAVSGEGVKYHRAAIEACRANVLEEHLWWPTAGGVWRLGRRMAKLGRFTPRGELVPLYVRRPEAEEVWEQRHTGRELPARPA